MNKKSITSKEVSYMKVIINKEGKYLVPGKEPFPSFTDNENDVTIYFHDNIASIIAIHLNLKTIKKNFNDSKKKCERCEHKWLPKKSNQIRICPKCKSPYWDIPRKRKQL